MAQTDDIVHLKQLTQNLLGRVEVLERDNRSTRGTVSTLLVCVGALSLMALARGCS